MYFVNNCLKRKSFACVFFAGRLSAVAVSTSLTQRTPSSSVTRTAIVIMLVIVPCLPALLLLSAAVAARSGHSVHDPNEYYVSSYFIIVIHTHTHTRV